MNFRKLPKEKRNNLILIVMVTLIAVAGLGFGLIKYQYGVLGNLEEKKLAAHKQLDNMRDAIRHGDRLEGDLEEAKKTLASLEEDMASGDLYSWVINTVRKFKLPYKVELPQFSPISAPSEVTLLPNFPYKQASLTVAGTAHYHDLGRFLADFENQFPHIRLLNLALDVDPSPGEGEMLAFRFEIVTLVKPNQS